MKNQALFFPSEAIVDFLVNHGKGAATKDYEFIVAVMLKNFCEKQWGEKCQIGFEFKPEYMAKLPNSGMTDMKHVVELFRKGIEENTPVDCVIAKEKIKDNGKRDAATFQVKRFGIGRDREDTDELIEYINSLGDKYGKQEACLLIILDAGSEVEFLRVRDEVDISKFPFVRLMFGWMTGGRVYFGETYPAYGMEDYDPQDMIN